MTTRSMLFAAAALCGSLAPFAAAQTVWLPASGLVPPPRTNAALAFDWLRDRLVLFGGTDEFGNPRNDTWELDGTTWAQCTTAHQPPSGFATMDYNRALARVVLVSPSGTPGTTWEYDGVDWTPRAAGGPTFFAGHERTVYDSVRGVNVLYVAGSGLWLGETWEYDGVSWTQRVTPTAPPNRFGAGLVFDPLRGRTILHGGTESNGVPSRATWEYDGVTWTLASNAAQNPGGSGCALAFDAGRRRVVLFGGYDAASAGTTWEYDGSTWQARAVVSPSPRVGAALGYDLSRNECVMVGGTGAWQYALGDVYRYRALQPAVAASFGQGCGGTGTTPGLLPLPYQVPYVGYSFGVRLYSLPIGMPAVVAAGYSRTSYGALPLPFPLAGIGMPGCELLVSPDVMLTAAGSGAAAALQLSIPAQPALTGATFYVQGFALAPGANAANLVNTRALDCRIGAP